LDFDVRFTERGLRPFGAQSTAAASFPGSTLISCGALGYTKKQVLDIFFEKRKTPFFWYKKGDRKLEVIPQAPARRRNEKRGR